MRPSFPNPFSVREPLPAYLLRVGVILLYLATPVFAFIQWRYGLSLRLPGVLEGRPGGTIAYYAGMMLLGVLMLVVPRRIVDVLAILESAVHIGLLGFAIIAAYVTIVERAMTDAGGEGPDGMFARPINLPAVLISVGTAMACMLARRIELRWPSA